MSSTGVFPIFWGVPFVLAAFMYASEATFFSPLCPRPCPSPPPPPQYNTATFYLQVILANGTNNDVANLIPVAGIQGKVFSLLQFGTVNVFDVNITTTPSQNSTVIGKEYGTITVVDLNGFVYELSSNYVFTSGIFAGSTLVSLGILNYTQQVSYLPIIGGTNTLTYATGYLAFQIIISQPPYVVFEVKAYYKIAV